MTGLPSGDAQIPAFCAGDSSARKRRPRGHIHELPSGSFRAVVYAGVDPLKGKERYLRKTVPTWDAAQLHLAKLMTQVREERRPKSDITVAQALAQWLDVVQLAETTRERHPDLVPLYIRPALGDMAAAKLDAELLERFYGRLLRCREMCGAHPRRGHTCRPLASATVRQIQQIIRSALERGSLAAHRCEQGRARHTASAEPSQSGSPSPRRRCPNPQRGVD